MPQAVHCYSDSYSSARSALTSQSLDDQRPPSLSYSAPSTVATSLPHHPSDCENGECYLDRDLEEETPTEQDEAWIGLADELPAAAMLAKAGEIPILSANGLSRPFKSLWEGPQHIGQRQLIIFIRHFYCAGCQAYVRDLIDTITPVYFSLAVPTTVTIIGNGHPKFIPAYADKVNCPFPIYADPQRKLFRALKMRLSLALGKRPQYLSTVNGPRFVFHTVDEMLKGKTTDSWKMGNLAQNGGEFLFEGGRPVWCHRMRNMRDHAEMDVIRRVLDMDEELPVVEDATTVAYSPTNPPQSETTPTTVMPTTVSRVASSNSSPTRTSPMKLVWEGNGTVKAHLGRELSDADYY